MVRVADAVAPGSASQPSLGHGVGGPWRLVGERAGRVGGYALLGAVLVAYAVTLAFRMAAIQTAIQHNADAAAPALLADALASSGHGRTLWLSSNTFLAALWGDWATRGLPGHRILWEWWPYASTVAAGLMATWAVARVAGRTGAAVSALLCLCLPPVVLGGVVPQNFHGTTAVLTVVLGVFLVAITSAAWRRGVIVVAVLVGVATGVGAVSDPLLVVAGVIPFLVGVLVAGSTSRGLMRRRIWIAGVSCAGATLGAAAAGIAALGPLHVAVLPAEGVGFHLAPLTALPAHVELLLTGVGRMLDGRLGPGSPAPTAVDAAVVAALLAGAVAAVVVAVRHYLWHRPAAPDPTGSAPVVHVAYWSASVLMLSGAYTVSAVAADPTTVRYLTPAFFALASLAAVLCGPSLGRRMRRAAAAGALVVAALACAGVATVPAAAYTGGRPLPDLDRVASFLVAQGLHRGYADYWDAGALTWITDGEVVARPVMQGAACQGGGDGLCPYHWLTDDGWYDPQPGTPTFVVTAPGAACMEHPPPSALGRPLATYSVGAVTVTVYPADVATRFVGSRYPLCPPS